MFIFPPFICDPLALTPVLHAGGRGAEDMSQPADAVANARNMYEGMAGQYEEMVESDWAGDPLLSAGAGPTCRAMLRALELTNAIDGLVCDVGCGPGFNLHWLATGEHGGFRKERVGDLRGLDVSVEMIKLAQTRCCPPLERAQLVVADMTNLSSVLENNGSRCLFNLCTVQHFGEQDIRATLSSSWRALKPGGVLLLQFWSGYADGPMSAPEAPAGAAFMEYTRETLAAWVQAEGFELAEESAAEYEFEPGEPGQLYRFFFCQKTGEGKHMLPM